MSSRVEPSGAANMMNNWNDAFKKIANMKEVFISSIILLFVLIIIIVVICYLTFLSKREASTCNTMEDMYGTINGKITSLNANDSDCSGNLNDYYVNTAFNCCSGGSYKNDFVDVCNLKSVLKQGVRGLDFEIYSVDDKPVISTSVEDDFYIKETFNSVPFGEAMNIITNYGFSQSDAPNYQDPIIIHLRIKSNNQNIYTAMAKIFKSSERYMLGPDYSFENFNRNICNDPLMSFMGKIIIIVDRTNNAYLQNQEFLEYVNLTSNSVFMRSYTYYNVKNNPDVQELTEYNKRNYTIVLPDKESDPANPSVLLGHNYGCQMVAMRFQKVDSNLAQNKLIFNRAGYGFILKPLELRYQVLTIPAPTPQNPALSYGTRNVTKDFYSFDF